MQPDLIRIREVIDKSVKVILLAEELGDPRPLGGTVPVAIVAGDEWEEVGDPSRGSETCTSCARRGRVLV